MKRIAILGGGISGLAAAHRLQEVAGERELPVELHLLEARDRLGGTIATRLRDGFLLEEGPDSILTEKPWALGLAERLGLTDRLVGTQEAYRRSFVVRNGRLRPTPEGFYLLAPSRFLPLLTSRIFSARGKGRMAMDLFIRRRGSRADESLGAFVTRRLGPEALERMAQPMIAGIYGADPMKLSLQATFPRFLQMEEEYGSVIRGLWATGRKHRSRTGGGASGARYGLFAAFDGGLQVLVDALVDRLPRKSLHTRSPVEGLLPGEGEAWRVGAGGVEETVDAVVLALPAYQAAILIRAFDPELAGKLASIPYGPSGTVSLAFREADISHPMDGAGFVVPETEGLSILGCTFCHRKYPGRAPAGHALLRAFLGARTRSLSDDELVEAARTDLKRLLGVRVDPLLSHVSRYPRAMPHYPVGHPSLMADVQERLEDHPGLALAGNGYSGVGIPDCIHSGEIAAEGILERLFPSR